MAQITSTIVVTPRPPQVASVATVGATLQFSAFAYDNVVDATQHLSGHPMLPQPTFTWSTSNSSVATINSSGLATGVGAGTCTVSASVVVGLDSMGNLITIIGTTQFAVAMISPATQTVNFGVAGTTFSVAGTGLTAQWFSGIPVVAEFYTGDTNFFGNTATAVMGGTVHGQPSTVTVPVYCWVGGWQGAICQASLVVNNVPQN
jgi:hypothetical protein